MSTFAICNREPTNLSTANVGDSVRCALRAATGIVQSATRVYLGTGSARYEGGVLPENDERTEFSLRAFIGSPHNPVTRTVELDDSLKIVKAAPGNQDGLYFFGGLQSPMVPEDVLMFEFSLKINRVDVVVDGIGRSGVMAGVLINNSGFVIHFCADGVSRWIEVFSADQGAIQRINFPATTYLANFDWDAQKYTYKVLWHPLENVMKLYVSSGDGDTGDTLLISGLVSDFPTVPVDQQLANQPWAFFGHGPAAATSVSYWSFAALYHEAGTAIYNGQFAGGHTGFIRSDNTTLYVPTAELRKHDNPWNALPNSFGDLAGTEVLENGATVLTKSEPTKSYGFYRSVPRATSSEVVFDFELSGSANEMLEEASGLEVFVTDAARMIRVGFLTSGNTDYVGLLGDALSPGDLASYTAVRTSWHSTRRYRLHVDPLGYVSLKTIEDGDEHLLVMVLYTDMPAMPAPGAGVLPTPALGVVLNGVYATSRVSVRIQRLRYSVNVRSQEAVVPVSPWVYDGPAPQSSYVSSDGSTLRIDGSLSSSVIRFNRPETLVNTGITFEFRARVESFKVGDLVSPVRETTGVGISVEDTARQIALVFADGGPEFGRLVFFALTSNWVNDLVKIRENDPVMAKRYAAVEWTDFHLYRVERTLNGKLELYLDDADVPVLSFDDYLFSYPAAPGPAYVRFGTLQASRFAVSEWKWLRYSVSNGFNIKVFPVLEEGEILQRFDKVMNVIVEAQNA